MVSSLAFFWWPVLLLWPAIFFVRPKAANAPLQTDIVEDIRKIRRAKFGFLSGRSVTLLAWTALVIAAARPVLRSTVDMAKAGMDAVIVLDVSGSMAEDGRFVAAKKNVENLLDTAAANFGIVVFADRPYILTPVTEDRAAARWLLAMVEPAQTGTLSNLPDAVILAVDLLKSSPNRGKAVIVLSDGEANAGRVTVLDAAAYAREAGIPVYAAGIGLKDLEGAAALMLLSDGRFFTGAREWPLPKITSREERFVTHGLYPFFLLLAAALILLKRLRWYK